MIKTYSRDPKLLCNRKNFIDLIEVPIRHRKSNPRLDPNIFTRFDAVNRFIETARNSPEPVVRFSHTIDRNADITNARIRDFFRDPGRDQIPITRDCRPQSDITCIFEKLENIRPFQRLAAAEKNNTTFNFRQIIQKPLSLIGIKFSVRITRPAVTMQTFLPALIRAVINRDRPHRPFRLIPEPVRRIFNPAI
jgi:hypothetical protein